MKNFFSFHTPVCLAPSSKVYWPFFPITEYWEEQIAVFAQHCYFVSSYLRLPKQIFFQYRSHGRLVSHNQYSILNNVFKIWPLDIFNRCSKPSWADLIYMAGAPHLVFFNVLSFRIINTLIIVKWERNVCFSTIVIWSLITASIWHVTNPQAAQQDISITL